MPPPARSVRRPSMPLGALKRIQLRSINRFRHGVWTLRKRPVSLGCRAYFGEGFHTGGVGGSNLRKKPRRGEAKSFEECRDAGLLVQRTTKGPGSRATTIHHESGQGGTKSPAEAGLVAVSIASGLPSAVRTREATRQARFINEGRRHWFLCRVSAGTPPGCQDCSCSPFEAQAA